MKVIIAGGRDYWLTKADFGRLDALNADKVITEVACGLATGADACGKVWAILHDIPVVDFPADWKVFGHRAGPIRNRQMAKWAAPDGLLIVFPGNDGTKNMVEEAEAQGLHIFDWRYGR